MVRRSYAVQQVLLISIIVFKKEAQQNVAHTLLIGPRLSRMQVPTIGTVFVTTKGTDIGNRAFGSVKLTLIPWETVFATMDPQKSTM